MVQLKQQINNETNPQRDIKDIQAIIIHHTGSNASDKANANFLNKDDYISTHYMVGKDGVVYHLMDDNRIAYHAGVSSWGGLKNKGRSLNWNTIGIEVNSNGKDFTDVQMIVTKELIQELMTKYNVPAKLILRHKDVAPKRKWDIGDSFWDFQYDSWTHYQNSLMIPHVSSWAKDDWDNAIQKNIIQANDNPQSLVDANKLEQLFFAEGIFSQKPQGKGMTLERAIVGIQRLKNK